MSVDHRDSLWQSAAFTVDARRVSTLLAVAATVVYTAFAISHWFVLDGNPQKVMVATAATSAGLALIMLIAVRSVSFPSEYVVNFVLGLVTLNTLLHMYVTGDARQTSNVVLVIVAMGFFLLRLRTAIAAIAAVCLAWFFIMPPGADDLVHYTFSMASALVLAFVGGLVRRRLLFTATRAAEGLERARKLQAEQA